MEKKMRWQRVNKNGIHLSACGQLHSVEIVDTKNLYMILMWSAVVILLSSKYHVDNF